jgi:hypothetical protein
VEARAYRDAHLKFIHSDSKFLDAHNLPIADPFTCFIFEMDALPEEDAASVTLPNKVSQRLTFYIYLSL